MERPGAGSYRMPLAMWLLFGAIFISFLVGGAFFYYSQEQRIREDESQKLLSIAELKAEEIARWRSERLGDATVALSGPFFSTAVKQWLTAPDPALAAQITERLESYRRGYRYAAAFIVDATGHIRLSAGMAEEHISPETDAFLRTVLREKRPLLSELYKCSVHNAAHLDVIAPLFSGTAEEGMAVAALILRVDPNEFLYPLIQSWPEQSDSAETLLVRRDGNEVVFLNELRHTQKSALNLRIPLSRFDIPAVRAVRGEEGVIEGFDYRGVLVLSALKHISDSSWYMVAKIDSAEAFSAWRFRAGVIIGGLCLAVYVIFSLMGIFWHIQRGKHYKELLELEKKEREGAEYFRATFEQSGVGVSQVAFDGRFMKVNPRFCDIVGYSSEELLQKSFPDVTHPDDRAADKIYIQKILNGEAAPSREKRYIRKDGSIVWGNVTVTVVRDASGKPSYFLPVVEDISARKRIEEQVETQRKRYHDLLAHLHYGLLVVDVNNRVEFVNRDFYDLIGLEEGTPLAGLRSEEAIVRILPCYADPAGTLERIRKMVGSQNSVIGEEVVMRDGRILTIDFHPIVIDGIYTGRMWLHRDITERKRAEEALFKATESLAYAQSAAKAGMWDWNMVTGNLAWSPEMFSLFEFDPNTGSATFDLWRSVLHPEDREKAEARINQAVMDHRPLENEYRIVTSSGRVIWIGAQGNTSYGADGTPLRMSGICLNITERKALESAREDLMNSLQNKNEEMESILYAASHDLRSPLVNIQGFSDRIRRYLAELDRILNAQISASEMCETAAPIIRNNIPKALGYVTASTDKMDALVSGLLKLSRLGRATHTPETIDMNGLIRETLDALKFQTQEARAVVTVGDLPFCWGDRHEIEQAFSNLLDNAIKYRDPLRPLTITVSGTVMGDRVTYTVADTGIGIKKGHQEQIWGLFSRLDPGGNIPGEGLGLALVKRIVQRNRGKVWVESEYGKGTVFYMVLPHDRTKNKGGGT